MAINKAGLIKHIKSIVLTTSIFVSGIAINAQAAFIDFDDLTYIPEYPEMPFFADTPVTDQYLSKGLLVDDGYLQPYNFFNEPEPEVDPGHISGPNFLLGGNFLSLSFVGDALPDFVGMYVGSGIGEKIFLEAYGTSGLLFSKNTEGDSGPSSTPYTHKQYVSFEADEGIKRINIWGYYNSRVSASIDDLTFTYAEVPEPSSFILLCLGVFAIVYRRRIAL